VTASTHTAPIRAALIVRLCTQLRSAVGQGVAVDEGWPGDDIAVEHIWIENVDGRNVWELLMGGRKARDDEFTIELLVRVNHPDRAGALLRCDELVGVIGGLVADDPTLNEEIDPTLVATTGDVSGPISVPDLDGNGFDAIAKVTLDCGNRIY
jgi:hypothetical protein